MRAWPWAIVLCLVILSAWRDSFGAPFIFDDFKQITENHRILSLWPVWPLVVGNNRPFITVTLAMNYAISETRPWSYHVFNLAAHLVAALALFGLARRSLRAPHAPARSEWEATMLAFSIALLWMIHPLQTQSVTYVIQRCESMMGMFFLLYLYTLARGAQAQTRLSGWAWGWAGLAFVGLGIGCKEVMLTAPVVGLAYDRAFFSTSWKDTWKQRGIWHALSFAVAAAAFVHLTPWIFSTSERASMGFGTRSVTSWEYLRTQPGIILHYLRLAAWPDVLCLDYGWPVAYSPLEIYGLGAVLLTMLAASVHAWRKWPTIGFLGLAFFVILAPTSSFIPIKDLAFEHRMYLPLACVIALAMIGLFWLLDATIPDEPRRWRLAALAVTIMAAGLWLRTSERNKDYRHPVRLWSKDAEVTHSTTRVFINWASALHDAGRTKEALERIERALELDERHAIAHRLAGNMYVALSNYELAARHYQRALELAPRDFLASFSYGILMAKQGKHESAIEQYRHTLDIRPKYAEAYAQLGMAESSRGGRAREASEAMQNAIRLKHSLWPAALELAWALATCESPRPGDAEEAVQLMEGLARDPRTKRDPWVHDALAAAYAQAGRFDEATSSASHAAELAERMGHSILVREIHRRLRLYQAERPYRARQRERATRGTKTPCADKPLR